jgi:hypothetical protein
MDLPRQVCVRRGGLFVAAALIATGLSFAGLALRLDFGTIDMPGPAFFPFVLGLALFGCSAAIACDAVRLPATGDMVECGHRDVLIALAAMLAVPALFETLGAYLTLGLFCVVLLVGIGRVRVLVAVPAAAVGMVGVWWFFQVLLGLRLPGGPL